MAGQGGFTLIELLVGMSMMIVVLGATMTVLDIWQKDNRKNQIRNETQDLGRTAIDQASRDLRSAASLCGATTGTTCTGSSSGALQRASSNDMIFQAVANGTTFGSNDASNQEWVRYCVDGSGNMWREILTPSSGAALGSMPSTAACPGPTAQWPTQQKIVSGILNGSLTDCTANPAPPFCYYNVSTNSGGSIVSLAKSVQFDLKLQSNTTPSLTSEITGGVDLRNSLASPTASFSCSSSSGSVSCDASGSTDPNGQALTYAWYQTSGTNTSCPPSGSNVATTQTYSPGSITGTYSFALVVTDTAGLNNCKEITYTF